MSKFIIKNRQRRKYFRRNNDTFSLSKPLVFGAVPFILMWLAIVIVINSHAHITEQPISFSLPKINQIPHIKDLPIEHLFWSMGTYIFSPSNSINVFELPVIKSITDICFTLLIWFTDIGIQLFQQGMTYLSIILELLMHKITDFTDFVLYMLGAPGRALSSSYNQIKPLIDGIFFGIKIGVDTFASSFNSMTGSGQH